MNLSGSLNDWTVSDLLNMLKVTNKTGSLRISGTRSGSIHFHEGRVAGAEVAGTRAGSVDRNAAVDSLFMLSSVKEGSFEMGPYQGPDGPGWDVDELVADMSRLEGLEADVEGAGLSETPLMLAEEIESAVTITPEDWWAMASLVSVLSLAQLEEVFGRARAIRLLHTLWRLGVVEAVEEIPEERVEAAPPPEQPSPAASDETEGNGLPGSRDDESWLDEIAASTEQAPADTVSLDERRNVRGLSAPASTTLTGAVLDDMRRLRGRSGDG